MIPPDQAAAIEGLRDFLKRHATCGGTAFDTPGLPDRVGYRAVAACRCGETVEYWVTDALLPPPHLVAVVAAAHAA
jgi:hypothetical protein